MEHDLIKGSVHVFGYHTKCYRQAPIESYRGKKDSSKDSQYGKSVAANFE